MSLHRSIDGTEPLRPDPVSRLAGPEEARRAASRAIASGSLACPRCDAPVALVAGPRSPAAFLDCPFCAHAAPLRDFLSLATPTRPARVRVRLVSAWP